MLALSPRLPDGAGPFLQFAVRRPPWLSFVNIRVLVVGSFVVQPAIRIRKYCTPLVFLPKPLLFKVRQQPAAIDHFFHQVLRQVEVLARGLEANPRIFPRDRKELTGQNDLGFQASFDFNPQAFALFGRQRVRGFGKSVAGQDKMRLVGD